MYGSDWVNSPAYDVWKTTPPDPEWEMLEGEIEIPFNNALIEVDDDYFEFLEPESVFTESEYYDGEYESTQILDKDYAQEIVEETLSDEYPVDDLPNGKYYLNGVAYIAYELAVPEILFNPRRRFRHEEEYYEVLDAIEVDSVKSGGLKDIKFTPVN